MIDNNYNEKMEQYLPPVIKHILVMATRHNSINGNDIDNEKNIFVEFLLILARELNQVQQF